MHLAMIHGPEGKRQTRGDGSSIRNLVIFAVVVLLSGWIGRGVDVLTGNQGPESPGMLIWIVAPVATAIALRAFAGDGWWDFGLAPRLRGNVKWYLIAIAMYPAVGAVVMLVGGAGGWISFSTFSGGALFATFGAALAPNLFKNLFEEFAWRGYLTPKLHVLKLGDLWGHVVVGMIWGLWHLPYYLFFLESSVLESYTSLSLTVFTVMATASIVSWAVVYGEIRLLTGSVWPAVLMHMMEDAFVNTLLLDGHVSLVRESEWLLHPGFGILNIALFLGVGIALYRFRVGRR